MILNECLRILVKFFEPFGDVVGHATDPPKRVVKAKYYVAAKCESMSREAIGRGLKRPDLKEVSDYGDRLRDSIFNCLIIACSDPHTQV